MATTTVAHSTGPAVPSSPHRPLSARERARIARQTAVVHQYVAPVKRQHAARERTLLDGPYGVAELERLEIRSELTQAGLL